MIPLDCYWDPIKCKFLGACSVQRNQFCHDYSSLQYINRDLTEEFYTVDNYSDSLYKKVWLIDCYYQI